jgi:hypothetical protein
MICSAAVGIVFAVVIDRFLSEKFRPEFSQRNSPEFRPDAPV